MNIKIRNANIDDLKTILDFNKALFEYETAFNTQFDAKWSHSKAGITYFTNVINGINGYSLVAEIDETVVGYVAVSIYNLTFRTTNPIGELDNVYIDKSYRRKGVGQELIKGAIQKAKEKGVMRLRVEAAIQNEKAITFYRKCGFKDFDIVLEMNT